MRLLLFFCFIQFGTLGQEIAKPEKAPDIIDPNRIGKVQVIEFGGPEIEYVGGMDSLAAFIVRNCIYPPEAIEKGIEGKVLMRFVVEGDGRLSNIEVARYAHPLLDAEAIRLISIMPKWEPLEHKGKPIRMAGGLPIIFKLQKDERFYYNFALWIPCMLFWYYFLLWHSYMLLLGMGEQVAI